MLEARDLSYTYPDGPRALQGVSLDVGAGEVVFLLGANGCGKSTLLACMTGSLRPDAGEVRLDGRAIGSYSPPARAQRIGLIPQIHQPVFAYSVREMVLMGRAPHLGLFARPGPADDALALAALERAGIAELADRPYTQLSGGQRQLVLVARGLAQACGILLMDEPDAHLDPPNQHRVMRLVRALAADGLSFVIATHSPGHALAYADRVVLMRDGQVLAAGPARTTLTEDLLSDAYGMPTEILYVEEDGHPVPRAILPRLDRDPGADG
jgi:iron complex transport system ATP-binding protein